ncbi:AAA family ATPase [Muricauda ruestringensis]|uniref:AAA family ATPase n=1 Tax=Flagellimonas aurea TaxID=2915619 RepID=A0ABS3G5M5_9FLAO|nr:AAA family ATPase [Allomuricauda aurea]MAO18627.1 hypothetical protein [Allomuricauda sp.]MBO0354711.1 AAA family ATPase [Allomuricauda aurea]
MLGAIKLNAGKLEQFQMDKTDGFIFGVTKFNVFAGVNNSGKSRLLREIACKSDGLEFFRSDLNEDEFKRLQKSVLNGYDSTLRIARNKGIKLKDEFNFANSLGKITIEEAIKFLELTEKLLLLNEEWFDKILPNQKSQLKDVMAQFKNVRDICLSQYRQFLMSKNTKTLYIPILRGLRPIQYVDNNRFANNDSFLERTKYDYFQDPNRDLSIYTGLTIYEDVRKLLLGDENQRDEIRQFEGFLQEYIFRSKVTLIPKYDEDVLHIKLGRDKQYEIYNLGDGLQTIISILFPVFLRRKDQTIICIEEPENHLHPAWQVRLLNALQFFDKHIFFFSSHSATFINNPNVSIFAVKKTGVKSLISRLKLENEKIKTIHDLGYRPSDLLQTNYILWVEGPSDKVYINYWVSCISPELKEGVHYSIMFYGGDNYQSFLMNEGELELTFIKRLNQNFGIILDSDRKNKNENHNPKKKEIQELFSETGNFCWLLKYREIENYVPMQTFKVAVEGFYGREVEIEDGGFADRCTVKDVNAETQYRSTIKLPQDLFTKIQKNKDGTTKGIKAIDLRNQVEMAIKETGKKTFKIKKVKIAEKVTLLKPDIGEPELNRELNRLVVKIRKANHFIDVS